MSRSPCRGIRHDRLREPGHSPRTVLERTSGNTAEQPTREQLYQHALPCVRVFPGRAGVTHRTGGRAGLAAGGARGHDTPPVPFEARAMRGVPYSNICGYTHSMSKDSYRPPWGPCGVWRGPARARTPSFGLSPQDAAALSCAPASPGPPTHPPLSGLSRSPTWSQASRDSARRARRPGPRECRAPSRTPRRTAGSR